MRRWGALFSAAALAGCPAQSPVERALEEHAAELRTRQVAPLLQLSCGPEDAEVLVDGVLQGSCEDFRASDLAVGPGAHRVQVRKAGFWPYEVMVDTGEARTRLKVELVPSS